MPRVIHLITGLATGGAEKALYNLLNGGLNTSFDNHVVSLSDEGTIGLQIMALGVPLSVLGMRRGWPSVSGLKKLYRIVDGFKPDVIQGWMYHGNLAASFARSLAPEHSTLVWNVRCSLYDLAYEKPMTRQVIRTNRFFSSSPDILLYNSCLSRKQHEAFGFTSRNGRVIPNGIDMRRFCFSNEARIRIRSELSIPNEAQAIGHVARLHPMKDHAVFLRAAVDVALRYANTYFILSGRGVSLEYEALEQLIPVHLRDRFHLLGERSDVSDLMCAMDVFCLSSAWGEGFPNVIGEAMAVGVPCVATNVGDSALIIGDCGVIVTPRDEMALAAGIEALLVLPVSERRTLGQQARNRIKYKFTLGEVVGQYTALYKAIILEKRKN